MDVASAFPEQDGRTILIKFTAAGGRNNQKEEKRRRIESKGKKDQQQQAESSLCFPGVGVRHQWAQLRGGGVAGVPGAGRRWSACSAFSLIVTSCFRLWASTDTPVGRHVQSAMPARYRYIDSCIMFFFGHATPQAA